MLCGVVYRRFREEISMQVSKERCERIHDSHSLLEVLGLLVLTLGGNCFGKDKEFLTWNFQTI